MNKIIIALAIICVIGTSKANNLSNYVGSKTTNDYNVGYHDGFNSGKNKAYNNVALGAFITGSIIVASIIIYNQGQKKCENGLVCKKF